MKQYDKEIDTIKRYRERLKAIKYAIPTISTGKGYTQ